MTAQTTPIPDLPGGVAEKSRNSNSRTRIETIKKTLFGRVVKIGVRRSKLTEDLWQGVIEGLFQPRTLIAVGGFIGLFFVGGAVYFNLQHQPFLAPLIPGFLAMEPITFGLVYFVLYLIDRRNVSSIVETSVKGSKTPVHIDVENTDIRETAEVVEGELNISGIHSAPNFLLNEPSKDGVQLHNVRFQKTRLGNEVFYANYVTPHFIAGDITDPLCNQMIVMALGTNVFRIDKHYLRTLERMRKQMELSDEFSGAPVSDVALLLRTDKVLRTAVQTALDANEVIHDIMGQWAFKPFDFDYLDRYTKRYVIQVDKLNVEFMRKYEENLKQPHDIFTDHTIFLVQAAKEAFILLKKLTVLREKILAEAQLSSLKDVLDYLHASTAELSEFNQFWKDVRQQMLTTSPKPETPESVKAEIAQMLEV